MRAQPIQHVYPKLLIIVTTLLIAGCQSVAPIPTLAPDRRTPSVSALLTTSPTPSKPAPSTTPSLVLSTTPTLTIAPTETATSTATWTALPTLPPKEAQEQVRDLLLNNGGCRLPCWWGMTPGVTEWNQARHFLETFVVHIGQGGEGYIMKDGVSVYATNYGIGYEREDGGSGFTIGVIDGIIAGIETGWDQSQVGFYLDRLLIDYGRPEEIFIRAHRVTSTGDPPPFNILLSYKKEGFWANYELRGKLVGEKVRGCPQSTNPDLFLFSPEQEWTREEMIRATYGPPIPGAPEYPTLSLEEATGMDPETFYEVFKESDNQSCLETPADLWH